MYVTCIIIQLFPVKGKLYQNIYFWCISLEVYRSMTNKEPTLSNNNDTNYKLFKNYNRKQLRKNK